MAIRPPIALPWPPLGALALITLAAGVMAAAPQQAHRSRLPMARPRDQQHQPVGGAHRPGAHGHASPARPETVRDRARATGQPPVPGRRVPPAHQSRPAHVPPALVPGTQTAPRHRLGHLALRGGHRHPRAHQRRPRRHQRRHRHLAPRPVPLTRTPKRATLSQQSPPERPCHILTSPRTQPTVPQRATPSRSITPASPPIPGRRRHVRVRRAGRRPGHSPRQMGRPAALRGHHRSAGHDPGGPRRLTTRRTS